MFYVDTSAIVTALDPTDSRRNDALKFLQTGRDKIVSELVLAELASILTRRRGTLRGLAHRIGKTEDLALLATLLYLLKRFDLKYYEVEGSTILPLGRFTVPLGHAIRLALNMRLKTLDLLHLSYIKALKERDIPVQALATTDEDFKKMEGRIREGLGVEIYMIG